MQGTFSLLASEFYPFKLKQGKKCIIINRPKGMLGIIYQGKDVLLKVAHVGINEEYIDKIMKSESYKKELERIRIIKRDRHLFSCVDKLSPISGVKNKLLAFQNLLKANPSVVGKILFIQYCVPNNHLNFIKDVSKENIELAKEINNEFGESVIYLETPVTIDQRLSLFEFTDTLLITSLRDGFCLLPFEYITVKKKCGYTEGKIIISEFAGCATALSGVIRINPYDSEQLVEAMQKCIKREISIESQHKFWADINYVEEHSTYNWISSLIADMKRGHNKNHAAIYLGRGRKRWIKPKSKFQELTLDIIKEAYIHSANRIIILDGEVTIS